MPPRWHAPRHLPDALALLAGHPGAIPMAGGTDLMVLRGQGLLADAVFVDIRALSELRGIHDGPDGMTFGALTTYTEIASSPLAQAHYPLLVQAARASGAWAVQNRGTLGGNIANASPAADTPPVLLVYGARIELASARGTRWLSYADFHVGYKATRRAPDELITRVFVPRAEGEARTDFYRKVGARQAQAISKVCFAAVGRPVDGRLHDVRIALGSVAAIPMQATGTAVYLRGRRPHEVDCGAARRLLDEEIAPIDDTRSTERYRRAVAGNVLEQFLQALGCHA